MKVLIFGDIFGKPGREIVAKILPEWKKEFSPDLVIANGENLSHGKGISETTIAEIRNAGVDVITGGNHTLEGKNASELLNDEKIPLLRPANFISSLPGRGFMRVNAGGAEVLIINAIAQSHMKHAYDSPYAAIEKILAENEAGAKTKVIIVDWHAETTSEKRTLGWWLDGHVSLVYGTHTHTPTADEQVLPKGTGFISDIGMTGPFHSSIGEATDPRIAIMVRQDQVKPDVAEAPPYEINAILVEIDTLSGKTTKIERIRKILQ
ncbi:MAG: YmdB family metallophosphoesterase [Candidatus Sungbacteria bacterium]|nr:YmdB family metallophosphoesterase [Candidatus Sungbacteria bacterium]